MLFLELEYNNNTSTNHSMRTQFNIGTEIILKESKTNELKEKGMDGKTDYMEEEQGKAQLYIYTLYIQQTDVFFCIYISILYSIYLLLLLLLLLSKIFFFLNIFDKKYFRKKKF